MWSVLPLSSTGFDYRLHLVICDRDQSVIWEESVFLPTCVKLSLSCVALCGCSVTLLHRKAGLPLVFGTLDCWKELARGELNGWLTLGRDETHLSLPHASVYWICIWVQLILYLTSSCFLDEFNLESFVEVFFVCVLPQVKTAKNDLQSLDEHLPKEGMSCPRGYKTVLTNKT